MAGAASQSALVSCGSTRPPTEQELAASGSGGKWTKPDGKEWLLLLEPVR